MVERRLYLENGSKVGWIQLELSKDKNDDVKIVGKRQLEMLKELIDEVLTG